MWMDLKYVCSLSYSSSSLFIYHFSWSMWRRMVETDTSYTSGCVRRSCTHLIALILIAKPRFQFKNQTWIAVKSIWKCYPIRNLLSALCITEKDAQETLRDARQSNLIKPRAPKSLVGKVTPIMCPDVRLSWILQSDQQLYVLGPFGRQTANYESDEILEMT